MLVGDAAGYLDPLTGEGNRLGFETASAALRCIVNDCPEAYDAAWTRITRRYWWLTSGLLAIRNRPLLRRRLVPFLGRFPRVFTVALDALNAA
jgi:flavin-dependent dehydrogenase